MSVVLFVGTMLSVVSCSQKKTESDTIGAAEISIDKCLDQAVEQYAVGYIVGMTQNLENCTIDSILKRKIEQTIPYAYSVAHSLNEVVNPENEIQKHYLLSWLLPGGTHIQQYVRLTYHLEKGVVIVSKISSSSYFDAVKTAIADISGDFSDRDYDTDELKAAVESFEQRKKDKKNPVSYEVIDHSDGGCVINYTLADGSTTEVHASWGIVVVENDLEYTIPELR